MIMNTGQCRTETLRVKASSIQKGMASIRAHVAVPRQSRSTYSLPHGWLKQLQLVVDQPIHDRYIEW